MHWYTTCIFIVVAGFEILDYLLPYLFFIHIKSSAKFSKEMLSRKSEKHHKINRDGLFIGLFFI